MTQQEKIRALAAQAYEPYERIEHPTTEDWQKSYNALKELCELVPEEGVFPNTLGYLCFYGRHTGGERQYEEARKWFEKGAALRNIESSYKLADMLQDGLGGPVDKKRALQLYTDMYLYCRDQFESGILESSFADTALRMGRLFHEGKLVQKNDMEALGYLLEAKFALEERKEFNQYGDGTVEKNIARLISECEQPDPGMLQSRVYGLGLGRIPRCLLTVASPLMSIGITPDERGFIRLEFRRVGQDGKKPNPILWSVPPAMRCFRTEFVVLYGLEVLEIWNKNPGEKVICDRYEYDSKSDTHLFYREDEVQCRLRKGKYLLPMDEFMLTEIRDHPKNGPDIPQ